MKVTIISQNDPFYTKAFFEEFIKVHDNADYSVTGVYFTSPMSDSLLQLIKRTHRFYGSKGFIKLGSKYAFTKLQEKMGREVTAPVLLAGRGYSVDAVDDVNSPGFLEKIRTEAPDLVVSVSCPQIFKDELLALPKLTCLNIHSGKLPTYRGLFPNFWQMKNGEQYSTVSIHEMTKKIDKGNLVLEEMVEIKPEYSLTDLIIETKREAAGALDRVIKRYALGDIEVFENHQLKPGYFKFPGRKDVKEFREKGYRLT
ncbi:MAG: formyltransferase family protein [Candidatus Dojkabacteria bacterium]